MSLSVRLGFLLALGVLLPHPASAVVYSYQGNNFAVVLDNASAPGTYTTSMNVSGSLTLPTALAAGITFGGAGSDISGDVTAFSFFDGRNTLTEATGLFLAQFEVGTDALGNIVAWDVVLQLEDETVPDFQPGEYELVIGTRNGSGQPASDVGRTSLCLTLDPNNFCSFGSDVGFVNGNPGSWNQIVDTGSGGDVPAPAGLPFLAAGLIALGLRRRL